MQLTGVPFQAIDWSQIAPTSHPGAPGTATWRVVQAGAIRIRLVDYSPGDVADHWCDKGPVIHVHEGELITELRDGRTSVAAAGGS